nr:MAG TPA: hypothetical protein [Caudoviricetes sp.]
MEFITGPWFTVLSLFLQCGILKFLYEYLKENKRQEKAREEEERRKREAHDQAIRSLLRTEIISIYHKAEEKGFLPIYNLENIDDMYKAYKTLGGNGAITELYNQVKNYPHNNPPGH